VKPDTQTIEIPHASIQELRQRGELPTTKEALAIELTMRVGELLVSAGAGAQDTVVMMRRICQTYGLSRAQIDITHTVILVSYYPGDGLPPFTSMRSVAASEPNLSKVYAVNDLVNQICSGMSVSRASKRFDRIRKAAPPYPGWLAGLAGGGISMSVQLFYTTSPKILILALITGYLVNRFVYLLSRTGLPVLFRQMFGAWLIVAIAAGVTWLNAHPSLAFLGYISPTTLAVGCIFQLVAGARFVAGIQDAIDGFYVTASARILQVVMLTAGLVTGLVTGLDLARTLGIDVLISSDAPVVQGVTAQFVAAVATAVLWAVSCLGNLRTVAVTAVVALVGWTVRWSVVEAGAGLVVGSFAGPMVAGLVTVFIVRRWSQLPSFGIINGVGMPFVPGLTLYLGLIQWVGSNTANPDPSKGGTTLGMAAAIALAISAGASLGAFLGRPASERLMQLPVPWIARSRRSAGPVTPAGGKLKHVSGRGTLLQPAAVGGEGEAVPDDNDSGAPGQTDPDTAARRLPGQQGT